MLACVVNYRPQTRQTAPKFSSPRSLFLCVELSDSFPPKFSAISHLPYLLPSSVSCNSFICHSYENCRGLYQQFPFWNSSPNLQIEPPSQFAVRRSRSCREVPMFFAPIPFLLMFMRTLLRIFAPAQNTTLFFSGDSALFAQKQGVWEGSSNG